jgi:hypothetical protein
MEAAYAKERERALRLKAALAQLQLTEAIVGGEKQPLDVLPLPKKGDRPTAQASLRCARPLRAPRAPRLPAGAAGARADAIGPARFASGPRPTVHRRSTSTRLAATACSQACQNERQAADSLRRSGLSCGVSHHAAGLVTRALQALSALLSSDASFASRCASCQRRRLMGRAPGAGRYLSAFCRQNAKLR